ncbi:conserved hypothetical protein [Candidatus Terasakiella magnetica]|uniref:Uncharacterized protein n=1 Tax=Candidatus Terasakiella magnetica TaxID=1867952 RepID=A0A1C3RFA3_9PROT|nr:TM0106 family RecB-like putative nuclease [Candidatus Terasakiella magnetica]SCA55935.1 conserved hypothetical protein [Candidatus Terasakiella magnetica]
MQFQNGQLLFSPSDLITFMGSPFASYMERQVLDDKSLWSLVDEEDRVLKNLQEKGYQHEDDFLEDLEKEQDRVVKIEGKSKEEQKAKTLEAMASGADVIAQGYLTYGQFAGLSDFLVKVPGKSKFGDYHYEVWDTKLSKKVKPYFAVQLCCYAEMLEAIQGVRPRKVAVVLGTKERVNILTHEVYAYYQALKSSFLAFHSDENLQQPLPNISMDNGRWSSYGEKLLKEMDHLCFVAGITGTQIKRLEKAGIKTFTELAQTDVKRIKKLNVDVFERLKAQAAIQLASAGNEVPDYKVLPHSPEQAKGLSLLPDHSKGDLFFDIEGFPLMEGGLEYLWGVTYFKENGERDFRDFWAHDHEQEKVAFSDFIRWAYDRWLKYPDMHIYHYASYEISAIRKLMGRYGVCEYEVDTLLRNNVFVDLYKVVKHGLLIGEPSYSIKNVEHIYRGKRDTDVASGGESVIVYEEWQNNPDGMTWQTSEVLNSIRIYNIDDCDSTQELTAWLRELKEQEQIAYTGPKVEEEKVLKEEETEATILRDKLLSKAEAEQDEDKQVLLRNLGWMSEFHSREAKPIWWRLFDRMGLSELELYDDMDCLAGLTRTDRPPFKSSNRVQKASFEYRFDLDQPFKGHNKTFYVVGEENKKVDTDLMDTENGIAIFKDREELPDRLTVIPDEYVHPRDIPVRLREVIEEIANNDFTPSAITDFLLRRPPRFVTGERNPIVPADLNANDFLSQVIDAVVNLDSSCLSIQGPPGAGKTYTAKHIIAELLKNGHSVGISSNSHKAIMNLMKGVSSYTSEQGITSTLLKVGGNLKDPEIKDYSMVPIQSKECEKYFGQPAVCFGGTAWAFSNNVFVTTEDEDKPIDYLFIDEAGQVSLANLIAMSHCCENIVLMGDQMQLGQPLQGSHPEDSGLSVLDYLLQEHQTIPENLGVFLPKTYRMNPVIGNFISEHIYESRLTSASVAEQYQLNFPSDVGVPASGICFKAVQHEGNTQGSEEEVEAVLHIVEKLKTATLWANGGHSGQQVSLDDILFVAPYNYQVNLLRSALGDEAKIGSVDKFQGQEAPIVIVCMCASKADESPRGLDFLFSKNRLNVALSRAQALAIVVGSPELAFTQANSIEQMKLVNFFSAIAQEQPILEAAE